MEFDTTPWCNHPRLQSPTGCYSSFSTTVFKTRNAVSVLNVSVSRQSGDVFGTSQSRLGLYRVGIMEHLGRISVLRFERLGIVLILQLNVTWSSLLNHLWTLALLPLTIQSHHSLGRNTSRSADRDLQLVADSSPCADRSVPRVHLYDVSAHLPAHSNSNGTLTRRHVSGRCSTTGL